MARFKSIALFTNDKGDNDRRPDMKGEIEYEDGEREKAVFYWNVSKKGTKYLKGSPDKRQEQTAREPGDDIDF